MVTPRNQNNAHLEPPYSQEAEQAVLGGILINPDILHHLTLQPDDFYILRHKTIWQAFTRLRQSGSPVDVLTLAEELHRMGWLNDIGESYITELVNSTPTSVHTEFYANIVTKAARRRNLMKKADTIKGLALDEERNIDDIENEAAGLLLSSGRETGKRGTVDMYTATEEQLQRIIDVRAQPKDFVGLPSVIPELTKLLSGYLKRRLYIIAGRPGMCKTSLLLSEAYNLSHYGAVVIFTMEMGTDEVVDDIVAGQMKIDVNKLLTGNMTDAEYDQYLETKAMVESLPIFINDAPGITPTQIRLECQRVMHQCGGIAAIMVDYIGLMEPDKGDKFGTTNDKVSAFSRFLKKLSKEFDCPVLAASQLSRDVEKRQDKRPMLSDLRDSGALEQDADVVIFPYRDSYYNPPIVKPEHNSFIDPLEIHVAKARRGKTGTVNAGFWGFCKRVIAVATEERSLDF